MPFTIEMTVRGVLLAGKWAKESDLPPDGAKDPKVLDGWRNALISALVRNSDAALYQEKYKADLTAYFQGRDNEALTGKAAVVIFLLEAGFCDGKTIKSQVDEGLRDKLIAENNLRTGRPIGELQGMAAQKLVQLGLQWFPTGTPKSPNGDGSLEDPVFGNPDGKGVDPVLFGYFQMLFEQARTRVLADDGKQAQIALGWINDIFPAIPADNLKKPAYANVVKPFTKSVEALRKSLGQKLDYFGNAWNHVPAGSLEFYKGQAEQMLTFLKTIEGKYDAYLSASRSVEERRSDYEFALNQTIALQTALEKERKKTEASINEAVSDFNASEHELEAAKRVLIGKLGGLSAKINEAFGLASVEQLAGILVNLSFMPKSQWERGAMIGSQALTAASDTFRALSQVSMEDGTQIDKSLVIHRIDMVGKDVTSLGAGYTVSQGFIQKDEGVYRLIQKAEEFEELCHGFYSKGGREAQAAMEDYIGKVKFRNAKIDLYNALWTKLGELQGQLATIEADRDKNAIALARSQNPGLPRRVATFANMYNRVRDAALENLYYMGRAYSFWALTPYDELTSVCKLFDPDSIDHATLLAAMATIERHCATQIETCQSELRVAAMPDADADLTLARGVTVTLTGDSHPEFIESLRIKGFGYFELSASDEAFGRKANVRLKRVRAWIYGLKTSNDIHEVIITHCGPETIVTTDGNRIDFEHARVTTPFRYDARLGQESPRAIFEGREGCHDGVILEENYAPIGPFARWRLAIPQGGKLNPDWSGINKVVMEFHVLAQVLSEDTVDPLGASV